MKESSAYQLILETGKREGIQEGHQRGLHEGHQKGLQEALTKVLVSRFGPLPPDLVARIQSTTDLNILDEALLHGIQISSLGELQL